MNARKDLRNEREANLALAGSPNMEAFKSAYLTVWANTDTLPPGFMKPVPVRVPQKRGIISTFAKLLGR